MSNVLIVADNHIYDYSSRNPQLNYRLHQWKTMANNIIEVGKNEGCDTIIFAGDIVEKSILRPYVISEVRDFLFTVMSNFSRGFIILGNHDLDGKSSNQELADSVLGVILPPNLYYAHQKTLQIDNTLIGFSNWQPEFDLTWISGKVDVLITHARICYSKSGGDLFKSQVLDESKFDLAICGDIHKPAELGKYVSVGISQKCKMGDSDQCTGVVLDCTTKQWRRVDLNPHDNLMKFAYTTDPSLEGWQSSTNTWFVFRKESGNDESGVSESLIPSCEDLDNLIGNLVTAGNLQNAHNEILKSIKNYGRDEVDFNFTLVSLHCENWRSIDNLTLNFDKGDKILVRGSIGSGKSSIFSALRTAFSGNRSMKSFIQFGKTNCLTEVEFIYQGNNYKLTRGTDTYGLEMNGTSFKYASKTYFEADVKARFPFTEYLDLLFVDHKEWFGGMSDDRRNLLLGKCLKLDRIDALHNEAKLLSEQFKKEAGEQQGKLGQVKKMLDVINGKLASITVPTTSKETLESQRQTGLEIQRKNAEWVKYITNNNKLVSQIDFCKQKYSELTEESKNFQQISELTSGIAKLEELRNSLQELNLKLADSELRVNYKNKEIESLKSDGNRYWNELQNLGSTRICPHCGQEIKDTTILDSHKKELEDKISEIKSKIESENLELQGLMNNLDSLKAECSGVPGKLSEVNSQINELVSKKTYQESKLTEISNLENQINTLNNTLSSLGNAPEKVELPENFMEIMQGIINQINVWDIYEQNLKELDTYKNEYLIYDTELSRINGIMEELKSYISLTSPTGQCYYEVLNKISTKFSDGRVNYTVVKSTRIIKTT